jgi:hypothetical protein
MTKTVLGEVSAGRIAVDGEQAVIVRMALVLSKEDAQEMVRIIQKSIDLVGSPMGPPDA